MARVGGLVNLLAEAGRRSTDDGELASLIDSATAQLIYGAGDSLNGTSRRAMTSEYVVSTAASRCSFTP